MINDGWYRIGPDGDGIPSGIIIDGAAYPLGGQPAVAKTKGWGNLSFLYQ
jgi:hypothetical protein